MRTGEQEYYPTYNELDTKEQVLVAFRAGTTSLWFGLGTFLVPAPNHAMYFARYLAYNYNITKLQMTDITVSSNVW